MVIMLVLAIGALFVYEGENSVLLSSAVIVCVCVCVCLLYHLQEYV